MAAIITPTKFSASMKVVSGTTESGTDKLSSISIGTFAPTTTTSAAANAIMAIVNLAAPCLIYTLKRVDAVSTSTLADD